MDASNDRKTRYQRREELREKWLAKQEADKEARILRKAEAEKLGTKWMRERAAWLTLQRTISSQNCYGAHPVIASTFIATITVVCSSYNRRPLGQWAKGKVWSDTAEMYV